MLVAVASTDMPHAISRALERGGCSLSSTRSSSWTRRQLAAAPGFATSSAGDLMVGIDVHFFTSHKRRRRKEKRITNHASALKNQIFPATRDSRDEKTRSLRNLPIARNNRRLLTNDLTTRQAISLADGGPIGGRITIDHTRSRSLLPCAAGLSPLADIDYPSIVRLIADLGDVKDVLAAEDDAARWPVASSARRRVKGDDYTRS